MFQYLLDKIISPSNPLRSLQINALYPRFYGENIFNECLHRILSQDLPYEGLEELSIRSNGFSIDSLDQKVFDKLCEITSNLKIIDIDF